ncbi:MAG: AlpA family transcriptional regulator [Magnetococcales bacterium]|nr:AlpA family transcriptional regulator [Magnetococcales bacterium]
MIDRIPQPRKPAISSSHPTTQPIDRILRNPEVRHITGLGRTSLYDLIRIGEFPNPVKLGPRTVGWLESQIRAWVDSRQPTKG